MTIASVGKPVLTIRATTAAANDRQLLTCPDDGQPRAVEHEMDGLAGRDQSQTAPQMLTAPGERRIVWGGSDPRMSQWDRIDSEMTPMRADVKALQERLGSGASDGCFHCNSFETRCKPSIFENTGTVSISTGDWTYVGYSYGRARIRGTPARILFVSMERPKGSKIPESFDATQRAFRESCFNRRNPHMGGTDLELECLLDPMTTRETRCQQFALTNSVRCVSVSDDARSKSTPTMVTECQRHTKAIVETLKPSVIVTQGEFAYRSICNIYETERIHGTNNGREGQSRRSAEVRRGGRVLYLRTAHPAHHAGFPYKRGPIPLYLRDAINVLRDLHETSLD